MIRNWHRDYDPSLGRYLQADPSGLAAGQSLFGYSGQSPLNFVDPMGLQQATHCRELENPEAEKLRKQTLGGLGGLFDKGPTFPGLVGDTAKQTATCEPQDLSAGRAVTSILSVGQTRVVTTAPEFVSQGTEAVTGKPLKKDEKSFLESCGSAVEWVLNRFGRRSGPPKRTSEVDTHRNGRRLDPESVSPDQNRGPVVSPPTFVPEPAHNGGG